MINEVVTVSEACALLDLTGEQLIGLSADGPFAADSGQMTLRQVLGCAMVMDLPMLAPDARITTAVTATEGAARSERRALLMTWNRFNHSRVFWLDPNVPRNPLLDVTLTRPVLLIPVDKMLEDLTARLALFRRHTARPN